FQVVKHTGDYPIYAFLTWLYVFSLGIVWGAIVLLQDKMIPNGVINEITSDIPRAALVLLCGAMYAIGMQIQLVVVGRIGLILSTSVSATCTILMGTVVSAFFGGLPDGVSFFTIFGAAILLVFATILCQYAGVQRDADIGKGGDVINKPAQTTRKDITILLLSSLVFAPFYTLAMSVGLRSTLRPKGFASLTCMGLLCIGAFIGTSIYTAVKLTKEKKWHVFLHPGKGMKIILVMALIAAFCHFGGNVLHAIAAPVVSVVIATTLGNSYSMWSYVWGLAYGEFRGAHKKTYLLLASGVGLFLAGIVVLSLAST
ncbi:MAG: hypothetical protein RSD23_08975, partial [Ruthenibacterium sp.]